ncbi:MAG TPA: nitrite reductase small subunit NirD [Methylocystis sp.]|nr:nitrite reductase small subunit NirD [Methylocystis sp.]
MPQRLPIGNMDQIPKAEGRKFRVDGVEVAVYRTRANEVFATQARCPHAGGPLADGLLGDCKVICPLHERAFDLRTGRNLTGDCGDLRVYPVNVASNGELSIELLSEHLLGNVDPSRFQASAVDATRS